MFGSVLAFVVQSIIVDVSVYLALPRQQILSLRFALRHFPSFPHAACFKAVGSRYLSLSGCTALAPDHVLIQVPRIAIPLSWLLFLGTLYIEMWS